MLELGSDATPELACSQKHEKQGRAIQVLLAVQQNTCFLHLKAHSWIWPGQCSEYGLFSESQTHNSGITEKFQSSMLNAAIMDC